MTANIFLRNTQADSQPEPAQSRESRSSTVRERGVSVVILGAGAAGTAVAAGLRRQAPDLAITIVDPALEHYYQPGFTLVGGGVFSLAQTSRSRANTLPGGVEWRRQSVERIDPDAQRLRLGDGTSLAYDYLVVAAGLELAWERVPGLAAALGDGRVVSMYYPRGAQETWRAIDRFRGGDALFTMPPMPIKCPGAPQKIVYLAADLWRRRGLSEQVRLHYRLATPALFSVEAYVPTLERVAQRHRVDTAYNAVLTAVDGAARTAAFERRHDDGTVERWEERYDLLHAVPPQRAPGVVRDSPIAGADGWVPVDHASLQHPRWPNVFALGDVAALPTSKTAAAVRAQVPVVVANLQAAIAGAELSAAYSGYASCPLITGYGRVVLAEFVYGRKLAPSLPWDSTRERRSAWWLKKYFLPWMYWQRLLRGRDLPVVART